MADGVEAQLLRQFQLVGDLPIGADIGQIGLHHRQVQFGPPTVRVCLDAAVCHHQPRRVATQAHVMGANPARGNMPDAAIAVRGIPDPDQAVARVIGVFGGEKPAAVFRECAVAIEVMTGRRGEAGKRCATAAVDHVCKRAGAAGKGNGFGAAGMGCCGVAACGQRVAKQDVARSVQPGQEKTVIRCLACGEKGGVAGIGPAGLRRHARCQEPREKAAARGGGHDISPRQAS